MADSGIRHVVSSVPVPRTEFEDEEFHALMHGNAFPGAPVERQLFYRDDTHSWYIYNDTVWKECSGGSADIAAHAALTTGVHGVGASTIAKLSNTATGILTTQGDILVRGGAAPERLAIGDPRFFLTVDADSTGLEWRRAFPFGVPSEVGIQFFHWTTTLTGTGVEVSKGYGLLSMHTGVTAGATARSSGYGFGWLIWSDFRLVWRVAIYFDAPSANSKRWIKVDTDTSGDPTGESIGFRIDGTAIKGIVHDGTDLHVIDLATVYSDANSLFEIRYDGTTVYWYVANVLKGQSTDIPSALRMVNHYLVVNVINGTDNTVNGFRVNAHHWVAEI